MGAPLASLMRDNLHSPSSCAGEEQEKEAPPVAKGSGKAQGGRRHKRPAKQKYKMRKEGERWGDLKQSLKDSFALGPTVSD